MNYHWKQFPVCLDCRHYRSHDNHKPFEKCNRENEPCLRPEKHHKFVVKYVEAEEPRKTIVSEMAEAWHSRNIFYRANDDWYLPAVTRLASIRSIWRAVRDSDYL